MHNTKNRRFRLVHGLAIILSPLAHAGVVGTFVELEAILTDQILLEDFEGVSLHAGGVLDLPNPLNSITVEKLPFPFDIQAGITYESPAALALNAGFIAGDDDVYLRSQDELEIRFDQAQVAFGFDLVGAFPESEYSIGVYDRDDALIETFVVNSENGISFAGYHAPTIGISRVVISHPVSSSIAVNNVAFGADFIACPGDVNNDNAQNFFDVSAFLGYFSEEDDRADFNDDGQFNFFDVSAFLAALGVACP